MAIHTTGREHRGLVSLMTTDAELRFGIGRRPVSSSQSFMAVRAFMHRLCLRIVGIVTGRALEGAVNREAFVRRRIEGTMTATTVPGVARIGLPREAMARVAICLFDFVAEVR